MGKMVVGKNLLLSPALPAKWPFLARPQKALTQGKPPKYRVSLMVDPKNADQVKFLEAMKAHVAEAKAILRKAPSKLPFCREVDKDGNETGLWQIKFGTQFQPKVFNAAGESILVPEKLGNDSILKVAYKTGVFNEGSDGLTLLLQAVQVIKLVEYEGTTDFGFTPEVTEGEQALQDLLGATSDSQGQSGGPIPDEDIPF